MEIVQRMDEYGLPAWITAMVVGFIVFWPIGLVILAYLIWSGRMGHWVCRGRPNMAWSGRSGRRSGRHLWSETTGNAAFDEYREDTLKRLEDEQREFTDFLDRLRAAKDKAEFDQFMSERRRRMREEGERGSVPRTDSDNGAPLPDAAR